MSDNFALAHSNNTVRHPKANQKKYGSPYSVKQKKSGSGNNFFLRVLHSYHTIIVRFEREVTPLWLNDKHDDWLDLISDFVSHHYTDASIATRDS